MADNFLDLSL